jgi:hypothetical protein
MLVLPKKISLTQTSIQTRHLFLKFNGIESQFLTKVSDTNRTTKRLLNQIHSNQLTLQLRSKRNNANKMKDYMQRLLINDEIDKKFIRTDR